MSYAEAMKASKTTKKAVKKLSPNRINSGDNTELGEYIRALRVSKGLSQREFGEMCKVHGAYIHQVENGKYRYPYELISTLGRKEREIALEILAKYQREDVGL